MEGGAVVTDDELNVLGQMEARLDALAFIVRETVRAMPDDEGERFDAQLADLEGDLGAVAYLTARQRPPR